MSKADRDRCKTKTVAKSRRYGGEDKQRVAHTPVQTRKRRGADGERNLSGPLKAASESSLSHQVVAQETALVRDYIKLLNESVELFSQTRRSFNSPTYCWLLEQIIMNKKKKLSLLQAVVLKRDDAIEDQVSLWGVISRLFLRVVAMFCKNKQQFYFSKLARVESTLAKKLRDIRMTAVSTDLQRSVNEAATCEKLNLDYLSTLENHILHSGRP